MRKFRIKGILAFLFVLDLIFLPIFFVLPRDGSGHVCGLEGLSNLFQLFSGPIFVAFSIINILRESLKQSSKRGIGFFLKILIGVIVLLFGLVLLLASFNKGERGKSFRVATMSNVVSFRIAQELFFDEHGRYAVTQDELFEGNAYMSKLTNHFTGKELTDKDGQGIEGGDDDPNTWSVSAYIPYREIGSWCRVLREGYWYTCNQGGCYKE